ncbi:histidinol dehydrogenase [Butyricicoccus sp.]|uniref:histidinol dehydrogenase n=1 Tax=Butyricicoccus sp. TaxID=2049021 RepID=UPI003F155AB7
MSFLKVIRADGQTEQRQIADMKARAAETAADIDRKVAAIMEDVRKNGMEAVERYSVQFDKNKPYIVSEERIQQAYDACPRDLRDALELSAKNIADYHEKMMVKTWEYDRAPGAKLGQVVRGLARVGIYVPGGTAAYPSTVLMNAVTAKVAGVGQIIMVTPPTENLSDVVLAAAKIAGVDQVIACGGVQAVAALTYGAGFIPAVDKIVGPGNAFVAAAKKQAFGKVDIDMIAGPSEVLVIADETADPVYVAADLLSQAEHDRMASAVLLTDSEELAKAVSEEMDRQSADMPRRDIIEESVKNYGIGLVFDNLEDACVMADEVAPEHLEVVTREPRALLPKLHNAGAIFLGAYSPEPLGDYMAGPCHVLPTSGTARFFSPLSTDTFLKKTSVIEYSQEELLKVADGIIVMAESEKLTAHANSVRRRKEARA